MKTIWKAFAWISIICAVVAYVIGWVALIAKNILFGIPTEFWFYDAIAASMFAVFFIIYGVHAEDK